LPGGATSSQAAARAALNSDGDPCDRRRVSPHVAAAVTIVGMLEKVAVIGAGAVGQACAFALMLRGSAREILLVDRIPERAAGAATDLRYGAPLGPAVDVTAGNWNDVAGAGVVLLCAGVNEKSGGATDRGDGQGRLRLLETNAGIYRDVVPRVVDAAPDAVLVAVTDPPDPLADLTRTLAGHDRVLGTGTVIDTLRFRVHVAAEFGVHPSAAEALVVGEHGTTEVMLWSSVRVGGRPLTAAVGGGRSLSDLRRRIEREVRFANITIIEGNDASRYGIGVACARITEAILRDERAVMPVAAYRRRYGVTIALPTIVGRGGAAGELEPSMSEYERRAFERSAATLREAAHGIGVPAAERVA
jgi:L-lactate dehydrogenase